MNRIPIRLLGLGLAVAVAACGQTSTRAATSSADPGAVPAANIDSLVLSEAEIESIGVLETDRQTPETTLPTWGAKDDIGPCGRIRWFTDMQPWSAFRLVDNNGTGNRALYQGLIVYPDAQTAQGVFAKYRDNAAACRQAPVASEAFTDSPNGDLTWSVPEGSSGNLSAFDIRVVKNVIIDVQTKHRKDGVTVATKAADLIAAKVNSAS